MTPRIKSNMLYQMSQPGTLQLQAFEGTERKRGGESKTQKKQAPAAFHVVLPPWPQTAGA